MSNVLLFGEPMALFVADELGNLEEVEKFTRTVSGAEVNVSIGLTRLGHCVQFVTRLGDDTLGRYISSFLKNEGISTNYIEYDEDYRTGIQLKNKVKEGDAFAPYFRKESAATKINKSILDRIDFSNIKLIHITGIPLALSESFRELVYEVIAIAKSLGIYLTFDPNIRKDLWLSNDTMVETIFRVAKECDLFLPGYNEAKLLTSLDDVDEIFDFLETQGISRCIMKMGPKGSIAYEKRKQSFIEGFPVKEIVDTVGAGDGFAVGVLSGILLNLPLEECAKRGNAIGAIQVTHWSDNQALPTKEELDSFINEDNT